MLLNLDGINYLFILQEVIVQPTEPVYSFFFLGASRDVAPHSYYNLSAQMKVQNYYTNCSHLMIVVGK